MSDNERKPTLQEVVNNALAAFSRRLPTSLPAKVTKFDASTGKVSCKVLVKRPYFDEEDARQVESIPVISGVPVAFPGTNTCRITAPISDGNLQIEGQTVPATTGLIIGCDRSIDKWLTGKGAEVDPQIDHDHQISDAVFMPGLNPFGSPLTSWPTDHGTIGMDAGVQIHFHGQTIVIGDEQMAQFIALANKVNQNFNDLLSAFSTGQAAVVAQDGGAALIAAIISALSSWPTDVSATQGKTT